MTGLCDEDGNRLVRTIDGDLVPVIEPEPDWTPDYPPDQRCAQHTRFDYRALSCLDCWSEIKAGERPKAYLGRIYPLDAPDGGRP